MTTQTASAKTDNVAIARAAYDAYVTKDRAAIEDLLSPDFHFTSPRDNRLDRDTYFLRCWPHSEQIARFDFVNLVPDANRVFVTYEGRNRDDRRFRNTEILTIHDHRIVDVEVYFGWSLPHGAPRGGFVDDEVSTEVGQRERRSAGVLADAQVSTRLPAKDLARARKFYSEKLGLEPVEERPGGLRYQCGGSFFALFESSGSASGTHTQVAWEVDDIDAAVAALRARGVVFEEYNVPGLRTANGIAEVTGNYPSKGNGERGAWFRDSEGNLLGIGQPVRRSGS